MEPLVLTSVTHIASALHVFGSALVAECLDAGAGGPPPAAVAPAAATLIAALSRLGVDRHSAVNLALLVAAELERGDGGPGRAGLLACVRDAVLDPP